MTRKLCAVLAASTALAVAAPAQAQGACDREMLQGIADELSDVAVVEQQPNLEGWRMTMMLSPEGSS
jgi:translation initiation factor IF-3